MKEEYHKKELLKVEDDVDWQGNKGLFFAKKDFHITILVSADFEKAKGIIEKLGLKSAAGLFQIYLIEN